MDIPSVKMDWRTFAEIPVVKSEDNANGLAAQGIQSKWICSTGQWLVKDGYQDVFLPHVPGIVEHGKQIASGPS